MVNVNHTLCAQAGPCVLGGGGEWVLLWCPVRWHT